MKDAQLDTDMVSLELPNLSLFLMSKASYESYSRKANRNALLPGASAPVILSCAVESKVDVDDAVEKAPDFGGMHVGAASIDPESGGYIGYITDPDGHLWELVFPKRKDGV